MSFRDKIFGSKIQQYSSQIFLILKPTSHQWFRAMESPAVSLLRVESVELWWQEPQLGAFWNRRHSGPSPDLLNHLFSNKSIPHFKAAVVSPRSYVQLFATPWTVQSMELSRPGCWSGQPFPSQEDLPNLEIEPRSPALQADSLPAKSQGKPKNTGVGSLSLLQRIFLIQEPKRGLLHFRWILYQPISGKPEVKLRRIKSFKIHKRYLLLENSEQHPFGK